MSDKKHAYRERLEGAYRDHVQLIKLRADGKTSKVVIDTLEGAYRGKMDSLPDHYKIMAREQTS